MPTPIMPLGRGRSMFDDFTGEDIAEIARAQDAERAQRSEIPRTQPNDNASQRVGDNETIDELLAAAFSEDLSSIERIDNYFNESNRGTSRRRNDSYIEREISNTIEQGARRSLEAARRIVSVPDQDAYSENAPSQLIDPDSYNSLYRRQQTTVIGARSGNVQQVIVASDQQKIEEAKILEEAKKNFDNPMAGLDV